MNIEELLSNIDKDHTKDIVEYCKTKFYKKMVIPINREKMVL